MFVTKYKYSCFVFALVFVGLFSFYQKALADSPTIVTEDITTDTTWTLDNSPYVVENDIEVANGATLTIEPGVIVKFNNHPELDVFGSIDVNGTASLPITLTSYKDDIGGDTNNSKYEYVDDDGNEQNMDDSIPSSNDWSGLYINDTAGKSTFSYTNFSYGGYLFLYGDPTFSVNNVNIFDSPYGIVLRGTQAILSSINENNISGDGLSISEDSNATVDNFTSTDVRNGIYIYNSSSLKLNNATISNISDSALYVFNNSSITIKNVAISNISNDAVLAFDSSSLNATGLIIDNSSKEAILVFNGSAVTFDNSSITNSQNFENGAVEVFNNSSFSATGSIFDTGTADGLITENGGTLMLSHSTVKNFIGSGVADYGSYSVLNVITIDHSIITGNDVGVDIYNTHTPFAQLNIQNNSIYNNLSFGARTFSKITTLELANNWWGDASGPYNATSNPNGLGDEVSDFVNFSPFCKNESCISRNPVIIVPGVLGTEISKPTDNGPEKLWLNLVANFENDSDDFMDPLQFNPDLTPSDTTLTIGDVIKKATIAFFSFDYSNGLIQEFKNQGYTEGSDLFLFPYDWRYGVSEDTVSQLKQKIVDILAQTGADKVDIVAHSTGGLIVKKYVAENPSDNNIDKAVFVGVPNTGAPKAVKALIEGDNFGNYLVADNEMKKISRNFPVSYDLLPSKEYFNNKGSYVKVINRNGATNTSHDLDFDQITNFLTVDHQLNSLALSNALGLHTSDFDDFDLRTAGVDLYAVDGCKAGTIGKFVETRSQDLLGVSNPTVSYSLETVPGDGTVPLESATNLPIDNANKFYALTGSHGGMLSQDGSRQEIVNIISGSNLEAKNMTQDISECKLNGRAISVFSPVSISIVDQDGNHSGLASDGITIENNIPNADFEIIGEHKFVYLPTDNGQTYTISVAGTGTGTFTITDATISNSNITQTQVFSDISVTPSLLGSISLSNNTNSTLSLDTDGNGISDQTLQPNSILDATQSQNFVPDEENNNLTQNDVPVGGGGLVSTSTIAENAVAKVDNMPVLQTVITSETKKEEILVKAPEIQAQIPIAEQKNNSVAVMPLKNNEKTKPISKLRSELALKPAENQPVKIPLAANVADTKIPVSAKVVLGGFLGILLLLLL